MIQPNGDALAFCDWLLNISWQKLSSSQRLIVLSVQSAATGNYPISNNTWTNFNKFTAWRFPFYQVYKNLSSLVSPGLLIDLLASYNFDGSSLDALGNFDGADANMTYPAASGVIGGSALFNGIDSSISVGGIPMGVNTSFALWYKADPTCPAYGKILHTGGSFSGLFYDKSQNYFAINLPGILFYTPPINSGVYNCLVVAYGIASYQVYLNGVQIHDGAGVSLPSSISLIGSDGGGQLCKGNLDILNFWQKQLQPSEAADFYNAGAGLQYPF